ncbi:MAG: ATP-binding protein [Bacteroidales bacterium]|nr:ATP-binding protein [Bacteroidales bacterium]
MRDIAQDERGFIWMATDGGVVRFDGHNFKTYPLLCSQTKAHDDNFAAALHQCESGLWVGTDAHVFVYDPMTDSFGYIPYIDGNAEEQIINVRHITSDRDGNLWISTNDAGVYRLRQVGDKWEYAGYPFEDTNSFVGSVFVDSHNDIWAVSNQGKGGVYRYDKSANDFRQFALLGTGAPIETYSLAISEDATNRMWIGDWSGELVSFDPFSGESRCITPNMSGPLDHIHTMTTLPSGMMMIGADTGLAIFDPRTYQCITSKHDELDPASLSDQFVYPICPDREGGIWIGTYYGGVNYMMPMLKMFERHQHSRFSNSVSGNVISAFAEDPRGNIYLASDDGGLSKYEPATRKFSHIQLSTTGRDNLHALMVDGNDLWIGSYSAGIYRMDISTGRVRRYEMEHGRKSSYAMMRDHDGNLWIATENILSLYNPKTDEITAVKNLGAQIVAIDETEGGKLWVATQGHGLFLYDRPTQMWRNYVRNGADGSLPHNHVNSLAVDSHGELWAATVAGLVRFDSATGRFEPQPALATLGSVIAVVEDQNTLWLTTNTGLVRYVPSTRAVDVFNSSDGLCASPYMSNAMLKASNGKIYVGSADGFSAFMPYQIRLNAYVPPVVFTALEINNATVGPGDKHLPQDLNQLEVLKMNHHDNSFAVSFASLSYANPGKNQYKYKLVGFDKDWIRAGAQNRAAYTNLPSGKYQLMVLGSNNDNVWNEAAITLPIEILPPWYASWPMKLLYILLISGALILGFMLFARRSEEKHKVELRRVKNEKEIEVYQAKLSFFTMVAHEIRTPVSLIIGPLEKLMKNPDAVSPAATKELTTIERNSQRLLLLVNQLLDFRKVEDSELRIVYRHTLLVPLVMGVVDRFRTTLEHKGVELEVDVRVPEDFQVDVDAEALTKLVSNLMNNARKYTNTLIRVTIARDGDRFTIAVKDDGIGVSKENQKKIFRPFYQVHDEDNPNPGGTGLGLSIVQRVAEAHGGKVEIESELNHGTCFTVTLPITQAEVDETPEANNEPEEAEALAAPVAEGQKRKMLVVDDNEELCHFIANSFGDKYEVLTAENGLDAIKLLKHNAVSLIISDWMMPKMDGVEFCRWLRNEKDFSHIPFVLLTAKTDNAAKVEGLNCGADAYVEKPFSLQVLEARFDNLLHMREMLRQKYSQTPLEPIESVAPHSADNEFLTQLTQVIEKNFSKPDLDVDFLASEMDMSRSTLYAKIRSLVDITPNDLVRLTRLKHAAKLLVDGRYRISEVCYMVGFNSSSYFAKCFQKQFGMTPSEFVAQSTSPQPQPAATN